MLIRLLGAGILAACIVAMQRLALLVHVMPRHGPTPAELGLGLIAVLAGIAGAAMVTVGPALFRPYAWPPPERD
jgi:hypothetical protein